MNPAVLVEALRKEFSRRVRAPGLAGIVALIGPNGAGKSTTIKILTGILHPTSGSATVLGMRPWKDRTRLAMNVATVFGQRSQLWLHLPAGETFDLLAHIYEIPRSEYIERRRELVERFDLAPLLGTAVRKLSLGQRMRCEIAASLLHRPRILFLDEPTIGLDVIARARIRELIRELNRNEGVSVLLTSHDAGDIEHLSKRVIVVNHGAVVLDDRVSTLRRRYLRRKIVRIRFRESIAALPAMDHVTVLSRSEYGAKLLVDARRRDVAEVMAILGRLPLADITIEDPPMEEIIAEIYAHRAQPRSEPAAAAEAP